MSQGAGIFTATDSNPNPNSACLCSPTSNNIDCGQVGVVFHNATIHGPPGSRHAFVGKGCLLKAAAALDGELLSLGADHQNTTNAPKADPVGPAPHVNPTADSLPEVDALLDDDEPVI